MVIVWRAVALTLLVAVVAACQADGTTFQTTLRTEGNDPLPVTLTDQTGLVTAIGQPVLDASAWNDNVPVLHADPDDPNASVLTWLGGMCDQDTAVWFGLQTGGYILSVAVHEKLGLGCPAAAVLRAIRISTSRPIPVGSVIVAGG